MQTRHTPGTGDAPHARPAAVASRSMRRSRRLALALSACTLLVPAMALAQGTDPGTSPAKAVKSPFKADRLSSQPSGLSPNTVASPVRYPDQAMILTWGEVPDAVSYQVEVASNPGFSKVVWKGEATQAIAVPDKVLPDGTYWWRVKAVDQAGTQGLWSDVAQVAKTWPSVIGGTKLTASPLGPAASFTALNPYLSWNPVPGAQAYDVEVSPGDQFNNVIFFGKDVHLPYITPGVAGVLPDDDYSWRVRARDPQGNPGPWTVASPFTKASTAPTQLTPAHGATTHDLNLSWTPVEGAERYEVQITEAQFTWQGEHLLFDTTTAATALTPTLMETRAKDMQHGNLWWRVRPIIDGVSGPWTDEFHVNWQPAAGSAGPPVLSSTGDTTTGLSPHLSWTPVSGMTLYRVDIATDSNFTNILESVHTPDTSWTSRNPLPDNQLGSGYWWRVIWGNGLTEEAPGWQVNPLLAPKATFKKQTRVTLGAPVNGGTVSEPPILTWGAVDGIAKFDVELSQDTQWTEGGTRRGRVFGRGASPGVLEDGGTRLPDGTWFWRVRAVDGGDKGQTWSQVGSFTLTSPRPVQKAPNDGAAVVYSPLLQWSPVSGAAGYDVQVSRDASFTGETEILNTGQTAMVPPKTRITTPGVHFWRVRANYGGDSTGQWSTTRSFRSVFPPDFNLNTIPSKVPYRQTVVVSGQLKNNGAGVGKARLYLERRTYPSDTFRAAGSIRTNPQGRFAFSLKMSRSADYRLVWREEATHPEGVAAFGIDVQPRVTFRLASSRVVRKKGLLVKGSVYPKRPAVIQMKTSDGWTTIRKVKPTRQRFQVRVSTGRIDPGTHRLRLWVPRDSQRKFANVSSRQRGVLVYDRFIVR
jgi:hypothetical protein